MIFLISKTKLKLYLLFFFLGVPIILMLSAPINQIIKTHNIEALHGKTIVIDPGHGGIDGGTCYGGSILEKEINLAISLKLKQELIKKGAIVVMTRDSDDSLDDHINNGSRHMEDLRKRSEIVNNSKADLFISIHVNHSKNENNLGPTVFYYSNNENSRYLAECTQKHLNKLSAYKKINKRLNRNPTKGNYFLLRNTSLPGIIIETGFISNEVDRKILLNKNHQNEITKLIMNSIIEYFGDIRYAERNLS